MKTKELIAKLRLVDPTGELDVWRSDTEFPVSVEYLEVKHPNESMNIALFGTTSIILLD